MAGVHRSRASVKRRAVTGRACRRFDDAQRLTRVGVSLTVILRAGPDSGPSYTEPLVTPIGFERSLLRTALGQVMVDSETVASPRTLLLLRTVALLSGRALWLPATTADCAPAELLGFAIGQIQLAHALARILIRDTYSRALALRYFFT